MLKKIKLLHPILKIRALKHKKLCKEVGISLRIYMTRRSMAEQKGLYDQGRTKPGKIVTNAKPGYSWHNFDLAYDCVEIKDGKALWNNQNWNKIGELGKKCGLEWGGDWRSFKDRPHFEYHPGINLETARKRHCAGVDILPLSPKSKKEIAKKIIKVEDNVIKADFQPSTISQFISLIKNFLRKFV